MREAAYRLRKELTLTGWLSSINRRDVGKDQRIRQSSSHFGSERLPRPVPSLPRLLDSAVLLPRT